MKRSSLFLSAVFLSAVSCTPTFAQQTDPTLTAAVIAQTEELRGMHNKRKSLQEKILVAETTVTLALDRLHNVEDKILGYLSNAQGVMTNIYQVKRAAELVGVEIPKNIKLLTNSVPGNLEGTAVTAIVSDEIKDVYAQMSSLFPLIAQLVTSGSYDVTNSNGEKEKHKVNLLNSAERYYIANQIVHKLEMINVDLYLLAWQVRTLGWKNLWFKLDPVGWATVMSGKNRVQVLINDWNRAF